MSNTNNLTPERKIIRQQRIIIVLAIIAVIAIAVALASFIVGNGTPSPQGSGAGTTDSKASGMNFDSMFESAESKYLAQIEESPDDPEGYLSLAYTYYSWAQKIESGATSSDRNVAQLYADAASNYIRVTDLSPTDAEAWGSLGFAYLGQASATLYSGGESAEDEANELAQQSIEAIDAGMAFAQDDDSLSEDSLVNMITCKADAFNILNKQDESIALLEDYSKQYPNNCTLQYALAVSLLEQGDSENARIHAEDALAIAQDAGNENAKDIIQELLDSM